MRTATRRVLTGVALTCLVFVLGAAPASLAGTGTWTGSTPAGGTILAIAAASNASQIYIATPSGVFKMAPGGTSWAGANTGLPASPFISDLKIDSSNSTLYAIVNGSLWKTPTSAINWTAYPTTGLGFAFFNFVFIDPTTSGASAVLYASGYGSDGSLWKSSAGGAWSNVSGTLPTNIVPSVGIVNAVAHTAGTAQVLVGGYNGLFRSTNGGTAFTTVRNGIPFNLNFLDFDQTAATAATPAIYAATGSGVYKSTTGGASWTHVSGGATSLPDSYTTSVSVDANHPLTVYVAQGPHVYKTINGGTNWTLVDGSAATALPATGSINVVKVNPSATLPNNVYVGDGFFRSTNGGTAWNPVNAGLLQIPIDSMGANRADGNLVLAGGESGDIYKSTNGTAAAPTYTRTPGLGTSFDSVNTLVWRPGTTTVAYAGASSGLYKGINGGVNWSSVGSFDDVLNIAIDPTGAKMFVVTRNEGVWLSTNANIATPTFTQKNAGLPFCPQTGGLAVNWGASTAFVGTSSGIFKTTNLGTSWTKFNANIPAFDVAKVIAVDPTTPTTVFAGMPFDGVWRSVGGAGWVQIDGGLTGSGTFVNDMSIPASGTIYLATQSDIFRTTNATAATPAWTAFNGGLPATSTGIYTTSVSTTKTGATISAHTGLNTAGVRDRNN